MNEVFEGKPNAMKAIIALEGVHWELAMILKYGRDPDHERRAIDKLRAALEALEGLAQ